MSIESAQKLQMKKIKIVIYSQFQFFVFEKAKYGTKKTCSPIPPPNTQSYNQETNFQKYNQETNRRLRRES